MKPKKITLNVIGKIKTPWLTSENMPIQPIGAKNVKGVIELFRKYTDGLKDITYYFNLSTTFSLKASIRSYSLDIKTKRVLQPDRQKDLINLIFLQFKLKKLKEIKFMY